MALNLRNCKDIRDTRKAATRHKSTSQSRLLIHVRLDKIVRQNSYIAMPKNGKLAIWYKYRGKLSTSRSRISMLSYEGDES